MSKPQRTKMIDGIEHAHVWTARTVMARDGHVRQLRRDGDSVRWFKVDDGYAIYSDGGRIADIKWEQKRKRLGLTKGEMILHDRAEKKKKTVGPKKKKTAKPKKKAKAKCTVVHVKGYTRKCPTKRKK